MKTITVKGVGTASATPDYVIISLGITSKSSEYATAVANANSRIQMLQEAIRTVGFGEDELKTQSFDVDTDYENAPDKHGVYKRKFVGYSCRYALKLSLDFDSEQLAKTITAISESDAHAEQSITFTVKEPHKISEKLLKAAAEDAREKAVILCAASGVTLGELVNISYSRKDNEYNSASCFSLCEEPIVRSTVPEFKPDDIKSSDTAVFVWEIKATPHN